MNSLQSDYTKQQQLIASLRDARRYPHAADGVQMIETHISWVLLAGDYAYKVKKALDLGFLDYSTLQRRQFCCEEEIRLNRRTAPGIYLDVVSIGGTPQHPVFGGVPAIEYAVRMRRFASDDLLEQLLPRGKVAARHIDSLAARVAHFHAGLPVAEAGTDYGTPPIIHDAALQNFAQLRLQLRDDADQQLLAALRGATEAEYLACEQAFETRRMRGFVRECHGDLHLGNIVLVENEPLPFDCIEFNPALRWIDVMDELAFMAMDLLHHRQPAYAWRFLNACLEASGDYAGVSVLRFYLAYRATVRAKVCAIRAGQPDMSGSVRHKESAACRSYLALAAQCLTLHRPALIITHGLPGSGKTTFAQLALEQMGAIRIRSDVERKRLFGLAALQSSRTVGDIYGSDATRRTYARLLESAREVLAAGYPVIVDAAFLKREERDMFRMLAQQMAVPFAIAALRAEDYALHQRLAQRQHDASEADVAVLKKLQAVQEPLTLQELAHAASFTTEEAPDSKFNARGWQRLDSLLATRRA